MHSNNINACLLHLATTESLMFSFMLGSRFSYKEFMSNHDMIFYKIGNKINCSSKLRFSLPEFTSNCLVVSKSFVMFAAIAMCLLHFVQIVLECIIVNEYFLLTCLYADSLSMSMPHTPKVLIIKETC